MVKDTTTIYYPELYTFVHLLLPGDNIYLIPFARKDDVMDIGLDKEKPGLPSSETLIRYQESQFDIYIGVEAPSSRPKSNEEKAVIETPRKLKDLRTKSAPRHTNFQQIARWRK